MKPKPEKSKNQMKREIIKLTEEVKRLKKSVNDSSLAASSESDPDKPNKK